MVLGKLHVFLLLVLTNGAFVVIIYALRKSNTITDRYRSGHNGADSKSIRVCGSLTTQNPLFYGLFSKFNILVFSSFQRKFPKTFGL